MNLYMHFYCFFSTGDGDAVYGANSRAITSSFQVADRETNPSIIRCFVSVVNWY